MKKLYRLVVLLLSILWLPASASCPPDSTGIKKVKGKTYILHSIDSADGWFSIARRYGITYAELRMANKDSADMLIPGHELLIPVQKLKANDPYFDKNYIQQEGEVLHVVKAGETLFKIARKYAVNVDSLKKWNHLTKDILKAGQRLRVITGKELLVPENRDVKKNKSPEGASPDSSKGVKKITEPLHSKTVKAPVKDETDSVKKKKVITAESGEVKGIDSTKIIKTASAIKTPAKKNISPAPGKGRKEINESGVAAWIRDDDINPNKYYALHRTAPIGTIIKVTNRMNKKYVFVKVVGSLPDTGDNTDLVIKISKASAEKLGVRDSRFQSELNYTASITEKQ
jgi:LysM repeat protein